MTFHVINSTNSIHNTSDTPLGGIALSLGLGDDVIVQADGFILATGAAGTGIFAGASADDSVVIVNGFVYGTSTGIHSLGNFVQITVNGQVSAQYTAISVSNNGYVYVSPTGLLSGYEGLSMSNSSVVNDGTINGRGNAIQLSSGWLTNNGLVSGGSDAIFYGGDGTAYITNTGTMQGSLTTYYQASAATSAITVNNSGDWIGNLWLSPGDDSVTNTGTITGSITLGDGNNTLDSRYGFIGGGVTAGNGVDTILLGAEDTIITPGAGADTIDGGAGFDIVSYTSSPVGVTVDLLNGIVSRGDAQGDRLSNIEGIYGSLYRDVLTGDNGNNIINGVLGSDRILGNGGNDTIIMLGAGSFVINSGVGNDIIQMTTVDSALYGYAFRSVVEIQGGGGYDTLEITGAPTMTFTSLTVRGIEHFVVNDGFNYNFTSVDTTVAIGARMWVDGGGLTGTNYIRFDGSAETNGAFDFAGGAWRDTFIGGAGDDTFTGGGKMDVMTGGGGADTFIYWESVESLFHYRDQITDFNTADDTFQLDVEVIGIDDTVSGSVSVGSDLASLLNGQLGASHAILVTVTGGTLNGETLLVVDANGVPGYQVGSDYVIDVTGIVGTLSLVDFMV